MRAGQDDVALADWERHLSEPPDPGDRLSYDDRWHTLEDLEWDEMMDERIYQHGEVDGL